MGLDQYAILRDENGTTIDQEFYYWRKHPNLHGWMERLWREKTESNETFNCEEVELTMEDIEALEKAVLADELPDTQGFFFGQSHPDDKKYDLEFIKKAKEELDAGYRVFYDSWW